MGQCEMCGADAPLQRAKVEGVELSVCSKCAPHGVSLHSSHKKQQINRRVLRHKRKGRSHAASLDDDVHVIDDVGRVLQQARQKRKLDQTQFADLLQEKESFIKNIERGQQRVSLALAKKWEKKLGLQLVTSADNGDGDDDEDNEDEAQEEPVQKVRRKGPLTIGDLIAQAKEKKNK